MDVCMGQYLYTLTIFIRLPNLFIFACVSLWIPTVVCWLVSGYEIFFIASLWLRVNMCQIYSCWYVCLWLWAWGRTFEEFHIFFPKYRYCYNGYPQAHAHYKNSYKNYRAIFIFRHWYLHAYVYVQIGVRIQSQTTNFQFRRTRE